MRSSDVLKNEFLFFNDQKQLDNKLRKGHEKNVKQGEKYDHFPFVSGEMLDQHRKGLGVELRADLKNYMIAKSQGLVGNPARSGTRYSPSKSSQISNASFTGTEMSGFRSNRLERNQQVTAQSSQMKPLNDSCYVVPEKNHRVIQDTNPVKQRAQKLAHDQYESQVSRMASENEKFMRSHYNTIRKEADDYVCKESERRAQINQNDMDIRHQMEEKVRMHLLISVCGKIIGKSACRDPRH